MNEYREGDSEVTEEVPVDETASEDIPTPQEDFADDPSPQEDFADDEEKKEIPQTAFMVLQYPDGRIEAATDMGKFKMHHQAKLPEVRDICHALYSNIQATIIAANASNHAMAGMQRGMAQQQQALQQMQAIKKQIITPGK